jgi:hypothetical protein
MIRSEQRIAFSTSLFAFAMVLLGVAAKPSPVLAAGGVPPFCVTRSGGGEGGGGGPQDCRYYDYQSCIQAAIARGNCVQNIDYHGEVSTTATPAPAPAPRARRRR